MSVPHTNHILQNNDLRVTSTEASLAMEQRIKESSLPRYQCLHNQLHDRSSLSALNAKKLLATQPVSKKNKKKLKQFTFISTVFELGAETKVWACPGAPEDFDFQPISGVK